MDTLNIPETSLPRLVVVGSGFAGLHLVKALRDSPVQIVMVDMRNYHCFQPLLYQVATAGLEPDSIAYPIRTIFKKQKNFFFRLAKALRVRPAERCLETDLGEINYDYLAICTGSDTNYFGKVNVAKRSMAMKNVPEALNLRSLLLQNFEAASVTQDLQERERLMNFVIVGAGPTGTELAGALAELKTHVLPNDYPDLDFRRMSIHLIEMADKVLPPMSRFSSEHALKYLEKLGVQVWLNTAVDDYDGDTVFTNRKNLPASTLIWAAGVSGNVLEGFDAAGDYHRGRFLVDEYHQIGQHEGHFALGDVAAMVGENWPQGHPMVAQVAIQQGRNLAFNLGAQIRGKKPRAFRYRDLGSMATVGRNKAVAELYNRLMLRGFPGWIVWMGVHLIGLVGFRNRAVVLINWVVNYFSYDRKIRLIIRPVVRLKKLASEELEK